MNICENYTRIPWDLMDMDPLQFDAFHAALSNEFVCNLRTSKDIYLFEDCERDDLKNEKSLKKDEKKIHLQEKNNPLKFPV